MDCCVEFITLIASEANEISEREAKKTIACEHVTAALKELGFPEYIAPVQESADDYKKQQAVSGPLYLERRRTKSGQHSPVKRSRARWRLADFRKRSCYDNSKSYSAAQQTSSTLVLQNPCKVLGWCSWSYLRFRHTSMIR